MNEDLENTIKEILKAAKPWQKVPTNVEGVFLVKTPSSKKPGSILMEINPTDDLGNPIKRRGIFLRKSSELEKFLEVMQNNKVNELLNVLEKISGSGSSKSIEPIKI